MKLNKSLHWLWFLLFVPMVEILKMIGRLHPEFIEKYYSKGLYLLLAKIISNITGIFPFSIGQIALVLFVIFTVFLLIKSLYRSIKLKKIEHIVSFVKFTVIAFSFLYLFYFLMLGANYYRPRVKDISAYDFSAITTEQLGEMFKYYVNQTSTYAEYLEEYPEYNDIGYYEILELAKDGYKYLPEDYLYMYGTYGDAKKFIFSKMQIKMGYSGMYFFYTAEPLVNSKLLLVTLPYISSHEIAHQRGISREGDANYIALLVCTNHEDPFFKYAGYLQCARIIGNEVYKRDVNLFAKIYNNGNHRMLEDLKAIRDFWNTNVDKDLEKKVDKIVEANLKANDQDKGLQTYNEVARYLIMDYFKE